MNTEKKLNYTNFVSIEHRFFKIKGLTPVDVILMSHIIGIISIKYKIDTYHNNIHKPFNIKPKTKKITELFNISSGTYTKFLTKMNELNLIKSFYGMDSKGIKVAHILFNFIRLKELIGEDVIKYPFDELIIALNNFRDNIKTEGEQKHEASIEIVNEIDTQETIPSTPPEDKKEMNKKLQELLKQGTGQFLYELDEEKIIEQNKASKTIPTEKPTPTITEDIKVAQSGNADAEAEKQRVSVGSTKNYIQSLLINTFSNNKEDFPFSDKFRNDIIYSRILECLTNENYHTWMMNAFTDEGFYKKSDKYLEQFPQKDKKLLYYFINGYITKVNEIEAENAKKVT